MVSRETKVVSAVIVFIVLFVYLYNTYFYSDDKNLSDLFNDIQINYNEKEAKDNIGIKYEKNITYEASNIDELQKLAKDYGANPETVKKMHKLFESIKKPIAFYGAILDQHGNPVSNATIKYDIVAVPGFSSPIVSKIESDSKGLFKITDQSGSRISIRSIHKEGYEFHAFEKGRNDFRHNDTDEMRRLSNYTSENPYTFNGWKFGKKSNSYTASGNVSLVPDGRTYSLSFGQSNIKIREGKDDASHILVKVDRPINATSNNPDSWGIYIEPINGGVIKTDDLYLYMAPQNGYAQYWEKNFYIGKKGYRSYLQDTNFYFNSKNKKVYGSMVMRIRPFRKDGAKLYMTYTINPTGSRSLN